MTKSTEDYFTDWEHATFGYGYGTGEAYIVPALKAWFSAVGRDDLDHAYDCQNLEDEWSPTVVWLLINILCHAGIIEYGSSPRYGWLTDEGKALKSFIDSKTVVELHDLTCRDEDYRYCYPDACNCGPNGYEEGRVCPNPFWSKAAHGRTG